MKAIIITRAIQERPDFEELRALLDSTNILKIAINLIPIKANIRLFMDWFEWELYTNPFYDSEQLVTHSGGIGGMTYDGVEYPPIPEELQKRYMFFDTAEKPCTLNPHELFTYPSSLGAGLDLAYKIGVKELLLISDNNIIEDGIKFFNGYCETTKLITDFYNKQIKVYQFSDGNFNLPVKTIKDFINA